MNAVMYNIMFYGDYIYTLKTHWNLPVVVVTNEDTLVRIIGPGGCPSIGAVDVGVVVVLPGVGLSLLPPLA